MKIIITIIGILFSITSYSQCDHLKVEKKDFTITTTTPTKIKEFSLSKIWFSDYNPPASLIYLFLHTQGDYLDPTTLKELSIKNNITIY